jgi:parallel beta-helix repeat protein
VSGNDYAGFLIENSHYGLYQDNLVYDNGEEGFVIWDSDYLSIVENYVYDNYRSGFYISGGDYAHIVSNIVYDNRLDGITIDIEDHCIIESNTVYNTGWKSFDMGATGSGIIIRSAYNCSAVGNTVYNSSQHGIVLDNTDMCQVAENTVYGNFGVAGECGIFVQSGDDSTITANVVYNNTENGIYMNFADYCTVTYNVVYENTVNGIYLDNCNQTMLYYNDFGWNPTNALDIVSGQRWNYWNNSEVGNWYSDYNDTEYYAVGDAVDSHPSLSLYAGTAGDVDYELGSTGNEVILEAAALNPLSYELYIDDELTDSFDWNGEYVHANVDGLDVGVYNITIIVYHISGHYLSADAQVTVEDTSPPVWLAQPENQEIYYGEPLSYQLSASDFSLIDVWSVNDTRFAIVDGLLTNNTVLELGIYTVHIVVSDIYDNELTADIMIEVIEAPTTTTSSTSVTSSETTTESTTTPSGGIDMLTIGIIAAAGGVVVLVVVLFLYKRKGT